MQAHRHLSKTLLALALAGLCASVSAAPAPKPAAQSAAVATAVIKFELKTGLADGKMVYIGTAGSIKGQANPTLKVKQGDLVEIHLSSGEGALHDFVSDELKLHSAAFSAGKTAVLKFRADKAGSFTYYCSLPGHRQIGMEGLIEVTPLEGSASHAEHAEHASVAPATPAAAPMPGHDHGVSTAGLDFDKLPSIVQNPADVPPAVGARAPQRVRVDLESKEVTARLADGTAFNFWTFNGRVPGPMLRVRVGDTVDLNLKNAADSTMVHSVDLHAVTGPGGAAEHLQVAPGAEKSVSWKAMAPGLYVYHCATPMVPHHISAGMYGMILVEPEGGLPQVDREFYVMQGDIYTTKGFGAKGLQEFSVPKMLDEQPDYLVFNGSVGALSKEMPLTAKVGETVRIYFGVGGPNKTSSFHVIGEIFDKVYNLGDITSKPLTNVQTVLVPPGGATMVEMKVEYPGNYMLVDHALSRAARGLVGVLKVEGEADPSIYNPHEKD